MRWTRRLAAEALVLAALAGCSDAPLFPLPRPEPSGGKALTFSVPEDLRSLDPAFMYDEVSNYAGNCLFDTLLGYDSALSADPTRLVPQLAEGYTVSGDGLRYRLRIRHSARFSDGQPVLAEDFAYALERVLAPEVLSPGAQLYIGILGAEEYLLGKADHVRGLRALDERTLEIELAHPDASFPMLLALKFATPLKKSSTDLQRVPLGTGPFALDRWDAGQRLVFRRNRFYWSPHLPRVERVVMRLLVPRDVAALEFLRGELDLLDSPPTHEYLSFARASAWESYMFREPQLAAFNEMLNVSRAPFNDRRVRQAMNYALNKEDTVRLYNGRAVAAHGMLPPRVPGFDPERAPYPYDPARARQLLAEAGYPEGFEVTYTTHKEEMAERLAESIQADLAKVGIRVRIRLLSWPAFVTAIGRGEPDFALSAWSMDYPDPRSLLETKLHSRMIGSSNDSQYSNPALDRLLDQARGEQDPQRRRELYSQADHLAFEDCPYIWHYNLLRVELRQPYVKNYRPHPVWLRDLREVSLDAPGGGP